MNTKTIKNAAGFTDNYMRHE